VHVLVPAAQATDARRCHAVSTLPRPSHTHTFFTSTLTSACLGACVFVWCGVRGREAGTRVCVAGGGGGLRGNGL
jgi:hypothetical protein